MIAASAAVGSSGRAKFWGLENNGEETPKWRLPPNPCTRVKIISPATQVSLIGLHCLQN